jgi:hypothetical protein
LQQRIQEYTESRPVEILPVELRNNIIRWLQEEDDVWNAALLLWEKSKGRPEIRDNFHEIIYRALYGIAYGSFGIPLMPRWNRNRYYKTADALEDAVSNAWSLFTDDTKRQIADAVIIFRALGKIESPKRPREKQSHYTLKGTCDHFDRVFGDPMYKAVSLLMEIGFGIGWPPETVKARYNELKKQSSGVAT